MKKTYSNSFLLDTHIWFWLLIGDEKKLNRKTRKTIDDFLKNNVNNKIFISAITVWEIALLHKKKQLILSDEDLNFEDWLRTALSHPSIKVLDLNSDILIRSINLPLGKKGVDIHKDPADRMIIATAMLKDLTLITSDKKIIKYGKKGFIKVFENKR